MWPGRYFPVRYWNARYWDKTGAAPPVATGGDSQTGLGQKKTFSQSAELGGGSW